MVVCHSVIPHPLRSSVPAQHPSHGSMGRRSRILGIWIRLSAHRRSSSTNSIGIRRLAKTPIAVINHYGCGRQLGRPQAVVWQTAFSSFRVGNVPGRLRSRARLGLVFEPLVGGTRNIRKRANACPFAHRDVRKRTLRTRTELGVSGIDSTTCRFSERWTFGSPDAGGGTEISRPAPTPCSVSAGCGSCIRGWTLDGNIWTES
jgi:hypothetical protein